MRSWLEMDPERKKVFYYSVASRAAWLGLACVADRLLPDHANDGFTVASLDEAEPDLAVGLLGGLLRWDAHHYLQIAEFGYSFESDIAFFPLFPGLLRLLGTVLRALGLATSPLAAHLLAATLLNNVVFVKASLLLYDLTLFVINDTGFSSAAALLYCVSPATVFFVAPYTETLFAYCAFKGMLDFSKRRTNRSLLWFFLSTCLRSNGVTFAGFILHAWAYYCLSQLSFSSLVRKVKLSLRFTLCTLQYIFVIFSPYLIFQLYCYLHFCHFKPADYSVLIKEHAEQYGLTLASDYVGWCYGGIVSPYFIVQEKLWNVGFLRYYQFKQIPNFILASPICYLIIYNGVRYLRKNWRLIFNPKSIYTFTLFPGDTKKIREDYPPAVFLFFVHALFLTVWGLLHINVQVLTRLLASSSPVLYWIGASAFKRLPKKSCDNGKNSRGFYLLPFEKDLVLDSNALFVKWYFISYAVIGIVMFCNGLPWT